MPYLLDFHCYLFIYVQQQLLPPAEEITPVISTSTASDGVAADESQVRIC